MIQKAFLFFYPSFKTLFLRYISSELKLFLSFQFEPFHACRRMMFGVSIIDSIPNKIRQMEESGYTPVAHFVLPEECWTVNFYDCQIQAQKDFLEKYKENKKAEELVENEKLEARLYSKYKDFYGYVFYIGKKN